MKKEFTDEDLERLEKMEDAALEEEIKRMVDAGEITEEEQMQVAEADYLGRVVASRLDELLDEDDDTLMVQAYRCVVSLLRISIEDVRLREMGLVLLPFLDMLVEFVIAEDDAEFGPDEREGRKFRGMAQLIRDSVVAGRVLPREGGSDVTS